MRPTLLRCIPLLTLALFACDDKVVDSGYPDLDGDGYSEADGDCDDTNSGIRPGAVELCDGIDNNCDGDVDGADANNAVISYIDNDGDGYGDAYDSVAACTPPSGYVLSPNDCDDTNPDANPGMTEDCDTDFDDDCNGEWNEPDVEHCVLLHEDNDGDGAGGYVADGNLCYCDDYGVNVANADDCDDTDSDRNPEATEVWYDGVDQNCDGNDADQDGDGFNWDGVFGGTDCDDDDPSLSPGALDWWGDGQDVNCDGLDSSAMSLANWQTSITGTGMMGVAVTACDFDGDGLGDLVTGSPWSAGYSGEVSIFYGANQSEWVGDKYQAHLADVTITGGYLKLIGGSLTCGDYDGDGLEDLAVGRSEAPKYTEFSLLYFYNPGGGWAKDMDEDQADADMELGADPEEWDFIYHPIHTADLDADGADEIVIHWGALDGTEYGGGFRTIIVDGDEDRYSGLDLQLEEVAEYILTPASADGMVSVSVLDDLDGDGGEDFAMLYSDWEVDPISGAIELLGDVQGDDVDMYSGSVLYASGYGDSENGRFGYNATSGDFDGDGEIDLLVSSAALISEFYLFLDVSTHIADNVLDPEDADVIVPAVDVGALSGYRLETAGDWNGDGADEIWMVESQGVMSLGGLWLLDGAAMLSAGTIEDAAMLSWQGEVQSQDFFGYDTEVLADIDGDGIEDFALGFPYYNGKYGITYLFLSGDF